MSRSWRHRVFAAHAVLPQPADLLEFATTSGVAATGHFKGDDQGWFFAELSAPGALALEIECFRADEEGVRGELNSWAAWLETLEASPQVPALMARIATAQQVVTILQPLRPDLRDDDRAACEKLCRFLAGLADGIYQLDGLGLFAADGQLLLSAEN
jgi:hypothetical protein